MFTVLAFVAIVVLAVQLANTRSRLARAEDILAEAAKRIGALQRHAGLLPPKEGEAIDPARWNATATPAPTPAVRMVEPEPEPEPEPELEAVPEAKPEPIVATVPFIAPAAAPLAEMPMAEPMPEPMPEPAQPVAAARAAAPNLAARFELLFGKQLPIWAGGITLAIAGLLIVKYAIDAGFFARIFTHGVQVAAGLLFGAGLIAAAELAWRNEAKVRDPRVPQALSGAGLATLYASVLIAASVYHLIGALAGFAGLAVITGAALGLALRFGSPSALLGLLGGLAAPALLGAADPHVPLLSVDLALTIGGLVGVSRMRRWPWLALAALLGGASWSLWLVLSAKAFDALSVLSSGGLVMLLALGLPALAFDGVRRPLLRGLSATVGALQLAILVAIGGFAPLNWGLFALLAAAGQVLAWRSRAFAVVPTISLALSALLLAIWPAPALTWFAGIALALAAIHAGPLLARLWMAPARLGRAAELAALALAAPVLAKLHFNAMTDAALAQVALGAALLPIAALGLGWRREDRLMDRRFALLTAALALLIALAALLVVPHWAAPLALAVLGCVLLGFGQAARDPRVERIAAAALAASLPALMANLSIMRELPRLLIGANEGDPAHVLLRWGGLAALFALFAAAARGRELRFIALGVAGALAYGALAQIAPGWSLPLAMALVAAALFALGQYRASFEVERLAGGFAGAGVILLALTGVELAGEWTRLIGSALPVSGHAAARWGGLAWLWLVIAMRARGHELQRAAQVLAALMAYGLAAQVLPAAALPLAPTLGGAALLLALGRMAPARTLGAAATFAALSLGWATLPLALWAGKALASLGGEPMMLEVPTLGLRAVLLRLLVPGLLLAGALWRGGFAVAQPLRRGALMLAAVIAAIAIHVLYRLGFAAVFGVDFVTTGLGERLGWEALLLGVGWWAARSERRIAARALLLCGTLHALVYTMGLHNPLWSAQGVGALPLANLLVPAFAAVPLGMLLNARVWPERPALYERVCQLAQMLGVAGLGWATLRQGFHGSVLTAPGVLPAENILRSLLLLGLAIGFLLWGIARKRHDWRIASLVLMLGAVGKVFLFDASGLTGLLRIGSFVALGFSLIGIGWLYSRQLAQGSADQVTED